MTYSDLLEKMQLVSCITKATRIAIEQKASVFAYFDNSLLTVENVELITSYLDSVPEIIYNFESHSFTLNIKLSTLPDDSTEVHCDIRRPNTTCNHSTYINETNNGILN